MKKTLIALAAIAAVGAASAQTTTGAPGFQITGNFNGGYVANTYKGNSANGFEQNGMGTSQIMFRGLEDLGGGLSAYFLHDTDIQFATNRGDTGTAPAAGAATGFTNPPSPAPALPAGQPIGFTNKGSVTTFGNDQKMVGLRGSFGDLAIGTINNSALYNYVVLVSPVAGTSYGSGYAVITSATPTLGTAVRWDNTIQYKSPVISGFQGTVQYVAKQTPWGAAGTVAAPVNYSPALGATNVDGVVELSGRYSNGPLTVAYTNQRTDGLVGAYGTVGTLSALGAAYDISPAWKVTAGVETITVSAAGDIGAKVNDRSNYMTGVFYTTGASTYWTQYGSLTENAAGAANGKTTTMASVGYKYALSKMTSIEARYERLDDQVGVVVMPGSLVMLNNDTVRTRSTVGVNVNF